MVAHRIAIGTTAVALIAALVALVLFLGFTMISSPSGTQASTTLTTTSSSPTSFAYLSTYGGCSAGGKAAPCWGSPAYVFNCLGAAKTQQGCTQLVSTTTPNWNFTINIRYPFSNQTEPSWANCLWSMQGAIPGQGYGHCTPVNSTSFTIGEPAPPPQ